MRKNLILIGLVAILALLVVSIWYTRNKPGLAPGIPSPTPTSQTTAISFPSGGETLVKGQTYTLKWPSGSGTTQIFLVDKDTESQGESVSSVDRKYGISNNGNYSYTVPTGIPEGNYVFEIGNLRSNPFNIASKSASSGS